MQKKQRLVRVVTSLLLSLVFLNSFPLGLLSVNAETTNVNAAEIVEYARTFIGDPYGHAYGPDSFDCCGLVQYVFKHFGISLPWNCYDYKSYGREISENEAIPGDLVVWHGKHVGIYSKSGYIINALNYKYGVVESKISTLTNGTPSYYIHVNGVGDREISFDGNGGIASKSSCTFTDGTAYGDSFPSATGKEGYSFVGWYTQPNGGELCTHTTVCKKEITELYAHWEENAKWFDNDEPLLENHVYRITNKKSGMALEPDGSSSGCIVKQQAVNNKSNQLWRVTYADDEGYYCLETLNGGMAMDMNASGNKYAYRAPLKIYRPNQNSDAQFFSLTRQFDDVNGIFYYAIHSKNTGRVLDVEGSSTSANAQIWQWDPHFGDGQLFRFEEIKERTIRFCDNLNQNYLPSPAEVAAYYGTDTVPEGACYSARSSQSSDVEVKIEGNSLKITQKKDQTTSSHDAEMTWVATMGDSYGYGINAYEDAELELRFTADTSVSGAKIYFRWGYDSNAELYSVSLEQGRKEGYSVLLPRTKRSANNLHPFIDKKCTVTISDIQLNVIGTTGSIGNSDAFKRYQTLSNKESPYNYNYYISAPAPLTERPGFMFDGWYTQRVGGVRIAGVNSSVSCYDFEGNLCLYAQWIKQEHVHSLETTVIVPTCESMGWTQTVCTNDSCGYCERFNYVPALGHDYGAWQYVDNDSHQRVCRNDHTHIEQDVHDWDDGEVTIVPTTSSQGVKTYCCTVCNGTKTEPIPELEVPVVVGISIKSLPQKTEYTLGDTLDYTGLVIEVSKSDGTSEYITSGFACDSMTASTLGVQTVTVSYEGFQTDFAITVQETAPEDRPQFVLSSAKARVGQQIDVTVQIQNNPGIIATSLQVSYDNTKLKLVHAQDNGLLGNGTCTLGNNVNAVPYTAIWVNSLSQSNITANGTLATYTFEVLADTEPGIIPITLNYIKNSTLNTNLDEVEFAVIGGSIEVVDYIPGDASGDGEIDLKDVAQITRYLAGGWDVTVDLTAADVNKDGDANLKDVVLLRRYLAGGWGVQLV